MDSRSAPFLLSLVLAATHACGTQGSTVGPKPSATVEAPSTKILDYELEVRIDPSQHGLEVAGAVQTERPRTEFWLNEALVIDALADDDGAIAF